MSQGAAIAAGHPLTVEAGASVLRDGGHAVDAAISAALMAFIAEPILASPMGAGFMLLAPPGRSPEILDFFAHTPRRKGSADSLDFTQITADFGEKTQDFFTGTGSIAVPGVLRGLSEAHRRYGRAPMAALSHAAFCAARDGVQFNKFQASIFDVVRPICMATPSARALWANERGVFPGEGTLFVNRALGDLIDSYAREGDRFFYESEPAHHLAALCAEGGHLRARDMRDYRAFWRPAPSVARGDASIFVTPPPSMGGALLAHSLSFLPHNADARAMARQLDATLKEHGRNPPQGWRAQRGTTHISLIDRQGFGASLTLTNGEGCGYGLDALGVMPNNLLGELDVNPAGALGWQENVRLRSMMTPTSIVWKDGRKALLGSGGSNRIRSALACVAARLIDGETSLRDCVDAPRIHVDHQPGPPVEVSFEDRLSPRARAALLQAYPDAHPWQSLSMYFGGVHAVLREASGAVSAAGDARRQGGEWCGG